MICRVCLKESQYTLEIFDVNGMQLEIADIIQRHFWFQPQPNDTVSSVICRTCWVKINDFHQFYLLVEQAHASLTDNSPKEIYRIKDEPTSGNEKVKEGILEQMLDFVAVDGTAKQDESLDIKNPLDETEINTTPDLHSLPNVLLEPINVETYKASSTDGTVAPRRSLRKRKYGKPIGRRKKTAASDSEASNKSEKDEVDVKFKPVQCKIVQKQKTKQFRCLTKKKLLNSTVDEAALGKVKAEIASKLATENEIVRKYIRFCCELCTFIGNDFYDIYKHFKQQHKPSKPYVVCCNKKLYQRCKLVQHAYTHEDPEYFKCTDCQKVFRDGDSLKEHKKYRHPAEDELLFACEECPKKFPRLWLLEKHKFLHVPMDERKFSCNECPKIFATDKLLQTHITFCHRMATNVCHICAKEYKSKYSFERHVRLHFETNTPRIPCTWPNCDQWLKDEEILKAHVKAQHSCGIEKIFGCNQCSRQFKNKKSLRSHINYTHSNKVYACEQCNKTFKKALTLREHMTQHTGETLYNCPFCTQTSNSNANMYAHKKKRHPLEWDLWRKTNRPNLNQLIKS